MSETVLVTGGAGFIGSNFLHLAHRNTNYQLIVLDALTYAGNLTSIADILPSKRVTFVKGDITDKGLICDIFKRYDVSIVVHFAAESHVDRSILNSDRFIKTNIDGTYCLLEAARNAWTSTDHHLFLHISSDEVFGELPSDGDPFTIDSRYQPRSPYSASKAAADHLVRAWNVTYGLPVIISNCSNNYGPWQFPEKLIPLTILNAMEGKEIPLYGDGLHIRDWIHVEDHCRALMAVIQRGEIGETYLVGAQQEFTNRDIVQRICDVIDEFQGNPIGKSRSLIVNVRDRPGHDRRYATDSLKLRQECDWRPVHRIEESLPKLIQWYADHQQWANEIRSGEYLMYYEKQYAIKSAHAHLNSLRDIAARIP